MEVSRKTLTVHRENFEPPLFIQFRDKINLLELLNANKVGISQSCGGFGTCTTCRIIVQKNLAALGQRSDIELERADERSFSEFERLACQSELCESAEVVIPDQRI